MNLDKIYSRIEKGYKVDIGDFITSFISDHPEYEYEDVSVEDVHNCLENIKDTIRIHYSDNTDDDLEGCVIEAFIRSPVFKS
jgi:hypothetical protein